MVLTGDEAAGAKPYTLNGMFEAGDFINHKKFGPGKVITVRSGKMEVGFEEGGKLLVCGMK